MQTLRRPRSHAPEVPQSHGIFRSLRWQLILRTLIPLGLLVVAFGLVGQIGYTQVTESLARSRDTEIAKINAIRVGDNLIDAGKALQQLSQSTSVLFSPD